MKVILEIEIADRHDAFMLESALDSLESVSVKHHGRGAKMARLLGDCLESYLENKSTNKKQIKKKYPKMSSAIRRRKLITSENRMAIVSMLYRNMEFNKVTLSCAGEESKPLREWVIWLWSVITVLATTAIIWTIFFLCPGS